MCDDQLCCYYLPQLGNIVQADNTFDDRGRQAPFSRVDAEEMAGIEVDIVQDAYNTDGTVVGHSICLASVRD
jgi:hypothetical protein